jgi:hypothetical protein
MTQSDTHPDDSPLNCEAFRHPNGWYLIRETDNDEGWLCTDGPVSVEQ